MSLIEEALRKQEHEESRKGQAPLAAAPAPQPVRPVAASPASIVVDPAPRVTAAPFVVPPVVTVAQSFHPPAVSPSVIARPIRPDVSRQRNLTQLMLGGIGVLVLLLLAGVVFLMLENARRPANAAVPAPAATASAVAAEPKHVAAPTLPVVPPGSLSATTPPAVVAPSAVPASSLAVSTANKATNVATVVAPVTPSEPAVVAELPVPTPPPLVVTWPQIVVKGQLFFGGKSLVQLADGSTLETGSPAHSGVRLMEAGPGWVRLSYMGETRLYRRNGGAFQVEKDGSGAASARH